MVENYNLKTTTTTTTFTAFLWKSTIFSTFRAFTPFAAEWPPCYRTLPAKAGGSKDRKLYHLFLHLTQIIHPYIIQLRDVIQRNNVPGFHNSKLINRKGQPPKIKKLMTRTKI